MTVYFRFVSWSHTGQTRTSEGPDVAPGQWNTQIGSIMWHSMLMIAISLWFQTAKYFEALSFGVSLYHTRRCVSNAKCFIGSQLYYLQTSCIWVNACSDPLWMKPRVKGCSRRYFILILCPIFSQFAWFCKTTFLLAKECVNTIILPEWTGQKWGKILFSY